MKTLLLALLTLVACASSSPKFENKEVCFMLFNLGTGSFERIVNKQQCEKRLPPASSFKVPLAVMAFDTGVLKDENTMLKWDGKKKFLEVWEKDHTAATWMRDSVVWFSQEISPKIGVEKIENYLRSFEYGNADMSGGIKHAWLTPVPAADGERNSLKVSGFEQLHFMKNLWRGELEAGKEAQLKAKGLLASETSSAGNILKGKTGSGVIGPNNDLRVGWWVGYLQTKEQNYVVVVNFTDTKKPLEKSFGGPEAKEIAKKLLAEKKLW